MTQGESYHYGLFANKTAYQSDVEQFPFAQRICALLESPVNECYRDVDLLAARFPVVFTHLDELLARGKPFRRLYFGTNWISVRTDVDTDRTLSTHPEKLGHVSFIGNVNHPPTDAYRFRSRVAQFCLERKGVDCYGKGIRPVESKVDAIAPYRFSIAMENAAQDLYFTEKLIDCLLLETIPIYFGCQRIIKIFDPRGILQFDSIEQLAGVLDSLDEETYAAMLPYALENKYRAISERWHNHRGLLERVVTGLPESFRSLPAPVAWEATPNKPFLSRLMSRGRQILHGIQR